MHFYTPENLERLRHKASRAALGLSCAACFEQPTCVFAGCGAVHNMLVSVMPDLSLAVMPDLLGHLPAMGFTLVQGMTKGDSTKIVAEKLP